MEAPDEGEGSRFRFELLSDLREACLQVRIRPRLFVESIKERTRAIAKTIDRATIVAPLLGTIRDHYRSQLKFDSAPVHGNSPAVQTAAIARGVPRLLGLLRRGVARGMLGRPGSLSTGFILDQCGRSRHLRQVKCLLDGVFEMGDLERL